MRSSPKKPDLRGMKVVTHLREHNLPQTYIVLGGQGRKDKNEGRPGEKMENGGVPKNPIPEKKGKSGTSVIYGPILGPGGNNEGKRRSRTIEEGKIGKKGS